jgi:hypothetical protein
VYPRFFGWRDLLNSYRGIFLLGVLGQTLIVFWAAREIWVSLKENIPRIGIVPLMVLLSFWAFSGLRWIGTPLHLVYTLTLTGWVSLVSLLNLWLVVEAIPSGAIQKTMDVVRRLFVRPDWPWFVAAWVTTVSALIAWLVLEGVPHIPDSVSYLFQAKYFSAGYLYLPAPPDRESFVISHVVNDGTKWYGYGFPGWPALLALGVLAGVPWLVNPVLAGLAVLLSHALVQRLYSRLMAGAVVSLLAFSPWFLFMSACFMSHPATLVWALLAFLAVDQARRKSPAFWGSLAGVSLGLLFLTRPVEGVIVGAVIGLWSLGLGGTRLALQGICGFVIASISIAGLLFPYCYALTGSATYTPHTKWHDETFGPGVDRIGFGPDIGGLKGWEDQDPFPGHGLRDVIVNTNFNLYASTFELYGWSFGSLAFIPWLFLWGRKSKSDWLLLGIIAAIIGGHSVSWAAGGPDFGARYWYQALIPFVILSIRGAQTAEHEFLRLGASELVALRVRGFIVIACVVAFTNFMPWRILGKYHRYRDYSREIGRLAEDYQFGHSLVFLRPEDYHLAFAFNPTTFDHPGTIYAIDAGPTHREKLQWHFPDRPIYFLGRSTQHEGRMRVLADPLPAMIPTVQSHP